MLTDESRLANLEAGIVDLYNEYEDLPTHEELTAVSDQIFDQIKDLEDRIVVIRNAVQIVSDIINTEG